MATSFDKTMSMTNLLYTFLFTLLFVPLTGQSLTSSLVSSHGGSFHQNNVVLTYSLGEVMTEGYATTSKLTQGFLQGQLSFTPIFESPDQQMRFKIYPNPFAEKITFEKDTDRSLLIQLYNLQGQIIRSIEADTPQMEIDLSGIPSQLFVAEISNVKTGRIIKSYRIFKSE